MKMKLDKKMPISLNDQVAHPNLMWPTPTTDSATNRTKKYKQGGTPLTVAVQQWPTPVARDHKDLAWKPTWKESQTTSLPEAVNKKEFFPTPNASDNRDRGNLSNPSIQRRQQLGKQLNLSMVVSKVSGALNPTWVEWLMGYPIGWTDLSHSETVSFPKSPTTSDNQSSRRWPTPTSTDGQRGDVNNLDGYRRRRDKWAAKGVNIHKPLDVAVALDEEEKDGKTD